MRIKFVLAAVAATVLASTAVQAQDFKPRIVRFGYGLVDDSNQGRAVRYFCPGSGKSHGRQDEDSPHWQCVTGV